MIEGGHEVAGNDRPDEDVEMDDPSRESDDMESEAFKGSAAPPVKTPGKNLNKDVERRKKMKASGLRMQIQSNRQVPSLKSAFKNSSALVSKVIRTCGFLIRNLMMGAPRVSG